MFLWRNKKRVLQILLHKNICRDPSLEPSRETVLMRGLYICFYAAISGALSRDPSLEPSRETVLMRGLYISFYAAISGALTDSRLC